MGREIKELKESGGGAGVRLVGESVRAWRLCCKRRWRAVATVQLTGGGGAFEPSRGPASELASRVTREPEAYDPVALHVSSIEDGSAQDKVGMGSYASNQSAT